MNTVELKNLAINIVRQACELKNKHTSEVNSSVNYACIFAHSEAEFEILKNTTLQFGNIVKVTPTGPIFHIESLDTVSGKLKLLKIRPPDKNKQGQGYADFTVSDYQKFKNEYIAQDNFKLITRKDYEIIGIIDSESNVGTYFAYPPMDKQLGID
jgi:hypothetical protein